MSSYIEGIIDYYNGVNITNMHRPVKQTNASILLDVDISLFVIYGNVLVS
jgi:hypothetical protein